MPGGLRGARELEPPFGAAVPVASDSTRERDADGNEGTSSGLGAFPVIGVGASAGGLEALTALFHAVQFDAMAFVVIQHRSAHHESLLAELLARSTQMRVLEIKDGMTVERNCVHLAPAGALVALLGPALHIVPSSSRLPIDFFFRSLAEELREHAIGIVLSGMGSDGTFGLQAIKEHGGICLAQLPETAKFDGMPRSAIDARVVDAALSPEALAAELASLSQHPYLRPGPRPRSTGLHKLYALLRDAFGHDLSGYKENTIGRRIERRMAVQKMETLEDYMRLLQARPEELRTLYRDLLINVTNFFRDGPAFEFLEERILPRIISQKKPGEPLRVWVPACSTGEEAYSIAMCVLEVLDTTASSFAIQVFGTDIDAEAVERARRGFYPTNIETDVSAARLARFFAKVEGGYQVGRAVRDLVVFSMQDVATDAPFSRMDLVSCRNLLIYMQPPLQKRVLATLHYALRPDGYLLLGSSETVGDAADLFSLFDRKTKFYEKKGMATAAGLFLAPPRPGAQTTGAAPSPMDRRPVQTAQQLADRRILDHYASPTVLITEDLDVLSFRGDTAAYVAPASGAATLNVMRLIRQELHLDLWHAVEKARKEDAVVRQSAIRLETKVGDKVAVHSVSIEVAPLPLPESQGRCFLIVFHEIPEGPPAPAGARDASWNVLPPARQDDRVQALEQELSTTKEFLQSTIEELESSNEELKSTNKELQSANEELQSTNEELESSKEEVQSTNEELTTVNDELQRRVGDLARRESDLVNVLRAVHDPVLIVDMQGRLRHYSVSAADLLDLRPTDLGRDIDHVRTRLGGAKLDRVLRRSAERIAPVTEDILAFDNRWYALTACPYANSQGALDGAVLTLVDVDARQRAAELRIDVSAYAEQVLPAVLHPLVMLDQQHRVVWANAAFFSLFQVDPGSTLGNLFHNLGSGQWAHPDLRRRIDEVLQNGQPFRDFLIEHSFAEIGTRQMTVSGSRVKDVGAGGPLALLSVADVTPLTSGGQGHATS